jgi:hypothetical protein
LTALGTRARATLTATAKEGVEDVAKAAKTVTAEWVLTAHVILTSRIRVTKHFVSVGYRLESLFRIGSRVHIWVKFASKLAISLFDLIGGGITLNAQYFIVVSHVCLSFLVL